MTYIARDFRMFNTNNLWINIRGTFGFRICHAHLYQLLCIALKRVLQSGDMALDIIPNTKNLDDGSFVLQVGSQSLSMSV